jgi:hypothetical protein
MNIEDILNPRRAIAELTVANTSKRIKDISAAIKASSARSSCLGLISALISDVERLETGVRLEIEDVASVMALVREVSSEVTEARAAAVSSGEEMGERVARVASVVGVSRLRCRHREEVG